VSHHTGPDGPPPGTIGEELARLVSAAQSWATSTMGEHLSVNAPECRFCPICRLLAALAGDRSGVAATLGGAADAFVDAVRTLLDPDPQPSPGEPSADRRGGRVERIEIS
jgi:hypothetical protein